LQHLPQTIFYAGYLCYIKKPLTVLHVVHGLHQQSFLTTIDAGGVAVESTAPVLPVASLPSTPGQWLQEFYIEKYTAAFKQNDCDTLHVISVMDKRNLDALGITIPVHRNCSCLR
jgi:hypothetical protein